MTQIAVEGKIWLVEEQTWKFSCLSMSITLTLILIRGKECGLDWMPEINPNGGESLRTERKIRAFIKDCSD